MYLAREMLKVLKAKISKIFPALSFSSEFRKSEKNFGDPVGRRVLNEGFEAD